MPAIRVAPSILSADFSRLGEELAELAPAGADLVHVDVMDGHFVPNLTLGPDLIASLRPASELPFDVHLMIETPERWLDVAWSSEDDAVHVGRLNVTIANEPGNLGSLTTVIGKQGGNISNLKITNRSSDFFEIMIDIEVGDVKHLTTIIAALRANPVINSVERARG